MDEPKRVLRVVASIACLLVVGLLIFGAECNRSEPLSPPQPIIEPVPWRPRLRFPEVLEPPDVALPDEMLAFPDPVPETEPEPEPPFPEPLPEIGRCRRGLFKK